MAVRITHPHVVKTPVYAWEPIAALLDDGLETLLAKHWAELALYQEKVPLSPDWERYQRLEADGTWRAMAARLDGKIIGYVSWFSTPSLHYSSTIFYETDVYWVDPKYRGGATGARLFKESLASFKRPSVVHAGRKVHMGPRIGEFLEALGFTQTEVWYSQLLE